MSMLGYRPHLDQQNTAYAQSAPVKGSVYKINLVAHLIKGMGVAEALLQLQFSKKKAARDMYDVLKSAIANAENNYSLDIDALYVSEVFVNKAFMLKRFMACARGRSAKILKPFSKISLFVSIKK